MRPAKAGSLTDIAFNTGVIAANTRMLKALEDYLELTRFSEEVENAEPNPEWTAGFQAAIAIIKGATK